MSAFKAKMHLSVALESLQRSPYPKAGFKGPTYKGREVGKGRR